MKENIMHKCVQLCISLHGDDQGYPTDNFVAEHFLTMWNGVRQFEKNSNFGKRWLLD